MKEKYKNMRNKNLKTGVILLFAAVIFLFYKDFNQKQNRIEPVVIKENIPIQIETSNETSQKKIYKEQISFKQPDLNSNNGEIVVFNPNSLKYHKEYCEWAKKCKRCIKVPKTTAEKKGARPCKICGAVH